MLALHKALVESERIEYEKTIGKIRSPNHFLQLLTNDPWFAWLSPLSQLIVSIETEVAAGTLGTIVTGGRAETVLFTLHGCRREPGTECAAPRLWKPLE